MGLLLAMGSGFGPYCILSSSVPQWSTAFCAQDAAEYLDARMESEDLDGRTEAVEVSEALEQVQKISLEGSEELDAYQNRHGPSRGSAPC